MTARDKFLTAVIDQMGKPVLMGGHAPDVFDCSELVAWGVLQAGGPDQRETHTAQRYHDEARPLMGVERPEPADIGFYGFSHAQVIHVVIYLAGGHVLSADGATHSVTDLAVAKAHHAAVRVHTGPDYRKDVPFLGWHRNTFVDALDLITR